MEEQRPEQPCCYTRVVPDSSVTLDRASLFTLLPLGVILTDDLGHCLDVNPAASILLGKEREEIRANPLDPRLRGPMPSEGAGRDTCTYCARLPRDGENTLLEVRREPCPEGGMLFFLSDVTETHSQKLHLERMTELYAALSQVNQAIVWSPNREALLAKICEVMVEFGRFKMAWIGWDDPMTHEVAVASHFGDTQGFLKVLQVRSDDTPLGRGGAGTAIRTGHPCVLHDVLGSEGAEAWHEAAARSNFATSASFPIRMRGQVTGVLTVYGSEKDLFGPLEIALLEEAAGDISFALDHLELDARRLEAEEALRASQGRLHRAETVASFGNWELTLGDGIMHASPGAHLIYGLQEDQLTLETAQECVLPECRSGLDQALKALIEEGRPYNVEFRIRRAVDGQERVIHSVAEYDASKQALFGVIHDITERKEIEDKLRESEFFFKESQRAAAIGSYKADFVKGFWESSQVLDSIFGIDGAYIRSIQGWVDLILPEDRGMMLHHLHSDVIAGHRPFSKQYRITRPIDGEVRWVQGLGAGNFDAQGSFVSLIGTIQDITDQKRAEQESARLHTELQQAQKMESLGLLAGGIAHDMNNVLGAILALASAHKTLQPAGSQTCKAFEIISEAATRGGDMVKSLLNFARKKSTEKQLLDLNILLREEAHLLEHSTLANVRLRMDLAPDLHSILGDAGALSNALMNLCVNAVDAMDGCGTLAIITRNAGEGIVEVRVEDTGCGMTQEVLDRAVNPFFTTKPVGKGTGLGLSMVYTTVTAHHGKLEIQSRPGEGTRISLLFPAANAEGTLDQSLPQD